MQLPRVCSYQSTNYTITMSELGAATPEPVIDLTRGPFNGTISSDTVVITENLSWGKTYQITVGFTVDVLPEALLVFRIICKFNLACH